MTNLIGAIEDRFKVGSVLLVVELRSAIRRRQMLGDISKVEADIAVLFAEQELKRIAQLPITDTVLALAKDIIERQRLRTLDAIQLATALDEKQRLGADALQFVASDKRLLFAAEAEGFNTWNPASSP